MKNGTKVLMGIGVVVLLAVFWFSELETVWYL